MKQRMGARAAAALGMLVAAAAALLATGCAAPLPTPPPAAIGLTDLLRQPAERALLDGMRAYDDARYADAEAALRSALAAGLQSRSDQAGAHKLLAFIACTSQRTSECDAAFRAARAAEPGFTLSRSEAGHPVWGPVYRQGLR